MKDIKNKTEKDWNKLTADQKIDAAQILKRKLVHNWLIPSNIESEQIKSFLEVNKPRIIFHFPEGKERVLTLNDIHWKTIAFTLQQKNFDKIGKTYHEEYHIEIPEFIGFDEIFNE